MIWRYMEKILIYKAIFYNRICKKDFFPRSADCCDRILYRPTNFDKST